MLPYKNVNHKEIKLKLMLMKFPMLR